jgi:glutamate/tyrosine decarboxylase-like PLP-dependent enzyme
MEIFDRLYKRWTSLDPRIRNALENVVTKIPITRAVRTVPFLQKMVEEEFAKVLAKIDAQMPHFDDMPSFSEIPPEGLDRTLVLTGLEKLTHNEQQRGSKGYVSGAVYHGGQEHIQFLNKVYALFSQSNPLHTELWPSIAQFEGEIVAMTAKLLGSEWTEDTICGNVSSGGTESTLLAMKAYRDWAREEKGIEYPEMIVPVSAHAAFDKASQYFGIKKITVPLDDEYQASVAAVRKAINKNTIVIVASAPSYPHGVMDPIPDLASLGMEKSVPLHVDACLGGFILPWIREDYAFPPFDFALKGVSSISVDTHKFGYANKGTSVILYRGKSLRHYQYYISTDWSGGLYASPTMAGSRPGALIAQCWAAMVSTGQETYRKNALKIVDTARILREGIEGIPHLRVLGHPLFVIAMASDTLDIFSIMNTMMEKGWYLNGLHRPDCFHICVTLLHTQSGLADRFLKDLKDSVHEVEKNPTKREGVAPIYGMASSIPARGVVGEFLKRYLDTIYKN